MPIVLNVFLSIPMNSFSKVQEDEALVTEDTVVVDTKIKRFKWYYFFLKNRQSGHLTRKSRSVKLLF